MGVKGEEERGKEGERGEEGREGGEREKAVGVLAAVRRAKEAWSRPMLLPVHLYCIRSRDLAWTR